MAIEALLASLAGVLSPNSKILRDEKSAEFAASMERWSDYDVKTPGAIVQPVSEQDVVATVVEALNASVPFVPTSGGHSPWSTIGPEGIVIDLQLFKGVTVDASKGLATVRGGTLMKEFQTALHPYKQFAAVGNGNTVGVIPFYLNGGISIYTPFIGYGAENIVSARLVSSAGELVTASATSHPDLLWALRGAGQFFGLVTELTVRTHAYDALLLPPADGTTTATVAAADGARICGTFVFRPAQAAAVCAALDAVVVNARHVSAGHCMVVRAPPDLRDQVLLVAPQVFASMQDAEALLRPLVDVGPLHHALVRSTFETHSDHLDWVCAKGDFKRFSQMGLAAGFNADHFKRLLELHAELVAGCPDAARSGYTIEWHSPCRAEKEFNSSFGHENVDFWLNVLSWHTDASHRDFVAMMDQKAQVAMRTGTEQEAFISYTNSTREDPIEYRYKGADRIEKLKTLKRQWDPKGVFTQELV